MFCQAKMTHNITAELWMQPVIASVGGQGTAPKGQDPRLVFNMKPQYVPLDRVKQLLEKAVEAAHQKAIKLFTP